MYMEGDIDELESRIYTRREKWDTHGAESEIYTELKPDQLISLFLFLVLQTLALFFLF